MIHYSRISRLAGMVMLLLCSVSAVSAADGDGLSAEGEELIRQERFADAEKLYAHKLKNDPGNPHVNAELAYVKYRQKKYDDALILLRDILEERSVFESAYFYMGLIYYEMEKFRDALNNFRLYQRIADRNLPRYAESHRYVAEGYALLLYREGLTRKELGAMLENYDALIRDCTDPDSSAVMREFVERVNRLKPRNHYGKWRLREDIQQLREVVADTLMVDSLGMGCAYIPTMASRKLQEDAFRQIRVAEKVKAPGCSAQKVVCTEFVAVTEDFIIVEGVLKRGSWKEKWDIDRCGVIIPYAIEFVISDEGRTYIFLNIAGEGTGIIPEASGALR